MLGSLLRQRPRPERHDGGSPALRSRRAMLGALRQTAALVQLRTVPAPRRLRAALRARQKGFLKVRACDPKH